MVRSVLILGLMAALCAPSVGQHVKRGLPLPPAFVEYLDGELRLLLLGGPMRVSCESGRFVLQLLACPGAGEAGLGSRGAHAMDSSARACNVVFQLPTSAEPEGRSLQPGVVNILRGNDPAAWQIGLPRYGAVRYREVVPGIDLNVRPAADGVMIELMSCRDDAPSLDLKVDGAEAAYDGSGDEIILITEAGALRVRGGEDETADGPAVALTAGGFLAVPLHRGSTTIALTTGPDLAYGSFFGGADADEGYGVASYWPGAGATRTYVCGRTASTSIAPSFPAGSFDVTHNGLFDAFVLKLNGAGNQLVYATYIGGDQDDVALDMVVDSSGNAYVTGLTFSSGFPTTVGAYDTSYNGSGDAFALALDTAGAALSFSTFLGGTAEDIGYGVAIDDGSNVYVTGQTSSTGFPLVNPAPKNDKLNGTGSGTSSDGFVTKIAAGGASLTYSTYVTGDLSDGCVDIVLDGSDQAHVVGNTDSTVIAALPPPFSTVPGFDPSSTGGSDSGFLVSLNAAGSQVIMRTFLEGTADDTANGVGVDANGYVYATGYTASSGFPVTTGSYDTSINGGQDAFLVRVELSTGNLAYGTFLGGGQSDIAWDMDIISAGVAVLIGSTASSDFPTTSRAFDTSANGALDVFVSKLDLSQSGGAALVGSTYLGGSRDDEGQAVHYDAHEQKVHCTGLTRSSAFPTTLGALDAGYSGGTDAFIVRVTMP